MAVGDWITVFAVLAALAIGTASLLQTLQMEQRARKQRLVQRVVDWASGVSDALYAHEFEDPMKASPGQMLRVMVRMSSRTIFALRVGSQVFPRKHRVFVVKAGEAHDDLMVALSVWCKRSRKDFPNVPKSVVDRIEAEYTMAEATGASAKDDFGRKYLSALSEALTELVKSAAMLLVELS